MVCSEGRDARRLFLLTPTSPSVAPGRKPPPTPPTPRPLSMACLEVKLSSRPRASFTGFGTRPCGFIEAKTPTSMSLCFGSGRCARRFTPPRYPS